MRRGTVTSALAVLLALGTVAGTTAGVQAGGASTGRTDRAGLPHPARGADAVRLLGEGLETAATRNDMTPAQLRGLLTTDASAWVDTTGTVFFQEGVATAPAVDPVSAEAPLSETFQLHSKQGSTKTIFLDFDGGSISATAWHARTPAPPTTQPAWDTGGDPAVFDDAERTAIQTIWRSVAEDYAPFDVDVTTADPGPGGIHRSDALDLTYGSHVMITPSAGVHDALCSGGCGGVAYLGVLGATTGAGGDGYGYYQPAWVFPHRLGNSPKNIAEAASHEVGHNFGLSHDGNATQVYDRGHGAWAPIMGAGYDRPITQWSKGDYAGATQLQDDVAVIRAVAGDRVDEAPTGLLLAPPVPSGTAYVTSRTDVDTYLLGTCDGAVTVAANPLTSYADLDLRLTVLDGLGQVVATDDPASAQTSTSTASGTGASLTRTLGPGTYYASVDGVGSGPWSTGYDDYGSMGAYQLAATGCDGVAGPVATTTSLLAAATGRTVTLTASPTALLGTLLGDVVFREGTTVVGTRSLGSPVLTLTDVTPGVHTYTATFVPLGITHLGSTSPATAVTVRATSTTGLSAAASGSDVTLDVQVATDGGTPAGVVELRDGTTVVGTRPLSGGAATLTLVAVEPGSHAYRATFVPADPVSYAGSSSPVRTVTIEAPAVPPTTSPSPTPTQPPAPYADPVPPPLAAPPVSSSTTTLRAPRRARSGTRPTVRVTVQRGAAPATGTVVVAVGRWSRTVALASGSARVRLPRLRGTRARVTVRYRGDATTTASTARRTIRVTG